MIKKVLKWSGISLLVIILLLAIAPFLFKDKIKQKIKDALNENLEAKVSFEDADLSLFSSFPNANVKLDKFSIINKAPFEGDTLVYTEKLEVDMGISELFNGEKEPMKISSIHTENTKLNILFDKNGNKNFDIAKKNQPEKPEDKDKKPFNLSIQNYKVDNLRFVFRNDASKMKMVLDSIFHEGKGDFEKDILDLDTKTTTNVTFKMEENTFMKNVKVSLDAILGIDLKNSKYTFKENKALINQLELNFDGFLQMLDEGQLYDLKFHTPTSDFKNFLALIPEQYSGKLSDVETTGKFEVKGDVKGKLSDNEIPKFHLAMNSNNASFHYKTLPKSVKNIIIDTKVKNDTGKKEDTYVNLDKFSFSIDQDVFDANAHIKNLTSNPLIDAKLKGTINLANLSKAYPVKLDKPLNGILKADVKTLFDMKAVEQKQYEKIQNSGNLTLTGFNYAGPELAKPMSIAIADVTFNNKKINLNKFNAKTGKSDLALSGTLENFYGFALRNQTLKGNFKANSSNFYVSDFMSPSKTKTNDGKTKTEQVKVPSFLDCSLTANANSVFYDDLVLKNVTGTVAIKDQAVNLKNIKVNVFGGGITFNGLVSTKNKTPNFQMDLGMSKVDIPQAFKFMNSLKAIAPIAEAVVGKLNSKFSLNGNLDASFKPDIKSLTGNLIGSIISGGINKEKSAMFNSLASNLNFVKLNIGDISLKDVKTALSFDHGKVAIKPFTLRHKDIAVEIAGSHGFDQNMGYTLKFDVPAKYLGGEVNKLLDKLTPADEKKIDNVPITANLTGNFTNPQVKTDLKQATGNLVTQLVQMQKKKYINQGLNQLEGVLNNGTKDSTKIKNNTIIKDKAGELLNGIFGKKKGG